MTTARRSLRDLAVLLAVVAGVGLAPAAAVAVAQPADSGSVVTDPAGVDQAVTFVSRGITFYGSLRVPDQPVTGVAALLLPGSGPTDRNGNQPGVPAETLARTADLLAEQGIPSYRFDKFGSGETGLGGQTSEQAAQYGFDDQVDDAAVAAATLTDRTGVAAQDLLVVGHSEGGLTALVLSTRGVTGAGTALLEPLPIHYLDLLRSQIIASPSGAGMSAEVDRVIASIRETGTVPQDTPTALQESGLRSANARFLAQADAYDPAALAAALPAGLPTLLTCSDKDLNVSCGQMNDLRAALGHTDPDDQHFVSASHTLGELGPLPASGLEIYLPLPVSTEYVEAMRQWGHARAVAGQ